MFAVPVAEVIRTRQFDVLFVLKLAGLWDYFRDYATDPTPAAAAAAPTVDGYRDITGDLFRAEEQVIPARYAALMGHDSYKRVHGALRQVRRA